MKRKGLLLSFITLLLIGILSACGAGGGMRHQEKRKAEKIK